MQGETSPQYWFQLPPKSTDEWKQIWESGVAVDDPQIDLDLVEQILMARNVIAPDQSFLAVPQVGIPARPVIGEFPIMQKIGRKMSRQWTVTLEEDRALFVARDGKERLIIDRQKGRPEFQFSHSGFLFLSEGTSAIVRGRTFDFGDYASRLVKWLPAESKEGLRKEQIGWALMMILFGALTLLMNQTFAPILGSVLVMLGVVNFIINHQGIWVLNGLGFLVNGALTFGYSAFIQSSWQSGLVVTLFWVVIGLLQVILGFRAAHQFDRY